MKNKIKQAAALVLVFLMLGGCAVADKNILNEAETTEQTTLQETVITTAEAIIEQTSAFHSEETTEKTVSSELSSTEKATELQSTTTQKATTTQQITATKKETTAQTVTTEAETTSAVISQKEEAIIIGLKKINFGCDMQSITDAVGNPAETVTETLSAGGEVKSLIYSENYVEFAVFQLLNGRFFGFYTVADSTIITDGESSYSLRAGGVTEFGNVKITLFRDSKKGDKAYALKASFNGFDYYPHELTSLGGQERLLFHTTNAIRGINGLYPLEYCEKASDCVRKHCEDMSARSYFSHNTPEGITSSQRMRNSGIEYTSCGENLAAGYLDAFGLADGWYNSSGHRKNMLDSKYRYLGVCVVKGNEDYNLYAGQNYYC